ncbi:MAG: methylated-DNA--[protein]-cysteine S-methyltransferase [Gemmatimonadaceae bacterium]|nr:methylated-DNA--[protein]-cysteine S-methyltransferase [Gemmatimonadaceae bacterium]
MRDYRSEKAAESYTLVPTAIGTCGLAWNDIGLTRLQLPEARAADTEVRLRRRGALPSPAAPRDDIAACIDRLIAYFDGQRVDFIDVPIDASALGTFDADIYRALRGIGWGRTTSYGALAASVGAPDAARAVGVAMSRNAWPIIVPCHRVLAAHGAMGGFSAYGGTMTKQMLLTLEGNGLDMLPLFAPEQ